MNTWTTRAVTTTAATAAALALAGCGGTEGAASSTGADGPTVVAGFYPLQWAAQRVGGDRVEVSSLTPPGAEAHDVELAPQDVAAIAEADLLVHLEGFQPALDDAARNEAADTAWDAGAAADLSLTAEDGTVDPHFWLDPVRMAAVGDRLAERLAELDPEGADAYRENAAALRADLEALDGEAQGALADCRVDAMVTAHDAFGYLGARYGLEVIGITGLNPSEEPTPEGLAEVTQLVRERGVTTVYTETLVDPAVAETVAGEAGVRTAVLDPIEGITDESAGDDYLEVMRANLATLQEGQSCS